LAKNLAEVSQQSKFIARMHTNVCTYNFLLWLHAFIPSSEQTPLGHSFPKKGRIYCSCWDLSRPTKFSIPAQGPQSEIQGHPQSESRPRQMLAAATTRICNKFQHKGRGNKIKQVHLRWFSRRRLVCAQPPSCTSEKVHLPQNTTHHPPANCCLPLFKSSTSAWASDVLATLRAKNTRPRRIKRYKYNTDGSSRHMWKIGYIVVIKNLLGIACNVLLWIHALFELCFSL